jgi:hypothetical protein
MPAEAEILHRDHLQDSGVESLGEELRPSAGDEWVHRQSKLVNGVQANECLLQSRSCHRLTEQRIHDVWPRRSPRGTTSPDPRRPNRSLDDDRSHHQRPR